MVDETWPHWEDGELIRVGSVVYSALGAPGTVAEVLPARADAGLARVTLGFDDGSRWVKLLGPTERLSAHWRTPPADAVTLKIKPPLLLRQIGSLRVIDWIVLGALAAVGAGVVVNMLR